MMDEGKPLGFNLYDPLTGELILPYDTTLDMIGIDDVDTIEYLAEDGGEDGIRAKQWLDEVIAWYIDEMQQPKLWDSG